MLSLRAVYKVLSMFWLFMDYHVHFVFDYIIDFIYLRHYLIYEELSFVCVIADTLSWMNG